VLTCSVDLSEFRAAVTSTKAVLSARLRDAAENTAKETAAYAKQIGPFKDRTRNLRTNIVARFVSSSGEEVTWEVLSPMYYSKFVDRGTSRARPYPFMTPAERFAEATLKREMARIPISLRQIWR